MTFASLGLAQPLLAALDAVGFDTPTPIQTKAIPEILDRRDVVGLAQTGSGKTAAFTLPLLDRLSGRAPQRPGAVRGLILSPTRELAAQIHETVAQYGKAVGLSSTCVVGGVPINRHRRALATPIDVLVATPGRLLDLIDQRAVSIDTVEILVLDEADQMLDIGFLPAIRRLLRMTPEKRQTLLFSATMSKEIRTLTSMCLRNPVEVSVAPPAATVDRIDQGVMHLPKEYKLSALAVLVREHRRNDRDDGRVIVFARTKRGADRIAKKLAADGIEAAAIHGNKSQNQRERALAAFRDGSMPVLLATDIAARGIDVPGVGLVVNFDLPNVPESYVHRIGRTARAGRSGVAVALCAPDDRPLLRDIEKLIRRQVPVLPPPEGLENMPAEEIIQPTQRPSPRAVRSGGGGRPSGPKPPSQPRKKTPAARPAEGAPTGDGAKRPRRRKRRSGARAQAAG